MSSLINTTSFVFIPPIAGKPAPRSSSSEETSALVKQSPQKGGHDCLYYALNTIRQRIGKNPPKLLEKERAAERTISVRRKLRTKHLDSLDQMRGFASQLTSSLGQLTRDKAEAFLKTFDKEIDPSVPEKFKVLAKQTLESFCNQSEDNDFVQFTRNRYIKKRIAINKWFLKQFKIDPKKCLESNPYYSTLSALEQQGIILEQAAVNTIFIQYGLKKSLWHPIHSVDILMQELSLHGPIVVSGNIGQPYYEDNPHKVEEIQKKPIYGWKPGSKTRSIEDTHCVTIIGARGGKNERVYFIDPLDGSDPKHPETQKIYAISYKKLIYSVCNWDHIQHRTESGEVGASDFKPKGENNYGVHGKQIVEHSFSSTSLSDSSSSSSSSNSSSSGSS